MESNAPFRYSMLQRQLLTHHADTPTSREVLARLSESLSFPMSAHLAKRGRTQDYPARHIPSPSTQWAYDECRSIIRKHSKSFYFSSQLLPRGKRHGIMALYAFCRTSDDIVDSADSDAASGSRRQGTDDGRQTTDDRREFASGSLTRDAVSLRSRDDARARARMALDEWTALADGARTDPGNAVATAWSDTRARFGIPSHLADELLDGIRMDLTIDRYQTWDDLWLYCYKVASTVGLMSMYITGTDSMEAVPYAVQLGVALQLTNILRDVGEDASADRVYLPAEEMARFGYTEEMLLAGVVNREFVRLMDFQIRRANVLYASALPGIAMLPKESRLAVTAAANIYRGILDKIRSARYDVFRRRAHLTASEKLRALPGIWWSARNMGKERR